MLADIEADLMDIVGVYDIDRLTRSLADFARKADGCVASCRVHASRDKCWR